MEPHFVEDFLAEFEVQYLPENIKPASITDLATWVANVNQRMGGKG